MNSPLTNIKSVEAQFVNALIEALNGKIKLPKYIIIILDKDILEGILPRLFDHGLKELLRDSIEWVMKTMSKILADRKEDLRSKKAGALNTSAEPRLVWTTILPRPHNLHSSVEPVFKLVKKGNEVIEEMVDRYDKYNHILYINNLDEYRYSNSTGKLTGTGKSAFWRELDTTMRRFDRGEIELYSHIRQRNASPTPARQCSSTENRVNTSGKCFQREQFTSKKTFDYHRK